MQVLVIGRKGTSHRKRRTISTSFTPHTVQKMDPTTLLIFIRRMIWKQNQIPVVLFSTFRVVSDPHKISNGPHHSWKEIVVGPLILKLWTWRTTWVSAWVGSLSHVLGASRACALFLPAKADCRLVICFSSLYKTFELVKRRKKEPRPCLYSKWHTCDKSGLLSNGPHCGLCCLLICCVFFQRKEEDKKTYTGGQWATFFLTMVWSVRGTVQIIIERGQLVG